MGIGASVFLLGVGAVLAFAVNASPSGLDVHVVGWILMLLGALGLFLTFSFWDRRGAFATRRVVDPVVADDVYPEPAVTEAPVVERVTRYRPRTYRRITRY